MNYCPNCGNVLIKTTIDETLVNKCKKCNFIDWDNWVNISCVVVAYNKNDEFLMVILKGKEEGKITFPGGYRNLGETLEEAAKREFYEETGMTIDQLELYKVYTDDKQRLVWIVYKTIIEQVIFTENNEVKGLLLVNKDSEINLERLRGTLTKQLYFDIKNDSHF